jgi:type I restriction enzyme S subunit
MKIETPGALKDWQAKPVGDIFEINSETLPNSTSTDFCFRYITLESVYSERIDFESVQQIRFGEAPSRARRAIKRGDILVSTVRPNLQGFAEFQPPDDEPYVCSTGFAVLRAKNGHDQQFYLQQLLSDFGASQFHAYVTGTNYPAISDRDFARLKLLVPKDKLEKDSSTALKDIAATITATRESIAKAERLQKGLMQQLLTGHLKPDGSPRRDSDFKADDHFGRLPRSWQSARVKNLIASCEYGLSRAMSAHGQYPIFRMNNIERGRMVASPLAYIDLSPEDFARYRVRKGDILFNRTNTIELVGKVGIFALVGDFVFASYLVRLVANEENDPRFLNYYLNSFEGQKRVATKVTPSIGQANINTSSLKSVWAVKPPLDEQSAIADRLDSIHELICAKEQKTAALQRLKKSLMQNLLTGRIRLPASAAPRKGK